MRLLQFYYTSCKRGQSSGSGFQIYSASEGLTKEEMTELEQRSTYVPPTHLPSQPTEEEIRNDFPVAFSSFRLHTGRYAVMQSVYVGQDYSGRFGNFFTHALILEEGEWPFATSLLYGSPFLRTHLTEDELNIEEKPKALPSIEIANPNGSLSPTSVEEFLQKEDRHTYLKKMLNGLIERHAYPGSLILAADAQDVAYWIAAIQLALPRQIANEISYSTYSFDPANDKNVLTVTLNEGTRFNFQDIGRRYNIYGFNFITNQFSEPSKTFRYTDAVVNKQVDMASLQTVANYFTIKQATEALDALLDIHTLLDTEKVIDTKRIQAACQFMQEYVASEQVTALMAEISTEQLIFLSRDIDSANAVAAFLVQVSNQTNDEEHAQVAAQFLIDTATDFTTDQYPLQEVASFLTTNMQKLNNPKIVHESFLLDEHLEQLRIHLQTMNDVKTSAFFLQYALQFSEETERKWQDLTNVQQAFLTILTANILEQKETDIAPLFAGHPTYFAKIVLALYEENSLDQEQIIQTSITVKNTHQDLANWASAYDQALTESTTGKQLLHDIFHIRFHESRAVQEKTAILMEAMQNKEFDMKPFIISYVDSLLQAEENIIANIQPLMQDKKIYTVLEEQKVLEDILNKGQAHIPFSDAEMEKHEKVYEEIIAYYKDKGITSSVYELALITFKMKSQRRKYSKQLTSLLQAIFLKKQVQLSETSLQAYVTWALAEIMDVLYETKKDQDQLIQALVYKYPEMILDAFMKRRQKLKLKNIEPFIVDLFIVSQEKRTKKTLDEKIVQFLVEHDYQAKKVDELLNEKRPDILPQWEKTEAEVQKQKGNSFVRSFKKLFKS